MTDHIRTKAPPVGSEIRVLGAPEAFRGFLFVNILPLLYNVRQWKGEYGLWDAIAPGMGDRIRTKSHRIGNKPTEEDIHEFNNYCLHLILDLYPEQVLSNRDVDNFWLEAEIFINGVSNREGGAWILIYGFAKVMLLIDQDRDVRLFAEFLLELSRIDRQLIRTEDDNILIDWVNRLFPWCDIENNVYQIYAYALLFCCSLARLCSAVRGKAAGYECGSKVSVKDIYFSRLDILHQSLPSFSKKNRLLLPGKKAISFMQKKVGESNNAKPCTLEYLAELLPFGNAPQSVSNNGNTCVGTRPISTKTLERIGRGDALLKAKYLFALEHVIDFFPFDDTLINLWTEATRFFVKHDLITEQEIVECFSHFEEVYQKVFELFEEFQERGSILKQ